MLQNPLVMNTPVTTHYLSSSSFEQTQAQCSEDQPLKVVFHFPKLIGKICLSMWCSILERTMTYLMRYNSATSSLVTIFPKRRRKGYSY